MDFYDSDDEATNNLSKKYVRLKRIDTSKKEYNAFFTAPIPSVPPILRMPPLPLVCIDDFKKYYEKTQHLISNTLNLLSSPQKQKNKSQRKQQSSRGKPSKRGRKSNCSDDGITDMLSNITNSGRKSNKATTSGVGRGRVTAGTNDMNTPITVRQTKRGRGRKTARASHTETLARDSEVGNIKNTQTKRGSRNGRSRASNAVTSYFSDISTNIVDITDQDTNIDSAPRNTVNINTNTQPRRSSRINLGGRNGAVSNYAIPTYSVGNTEEYIDISEDVPLFSSAPTINNEVVVLDDSQTEPVIDDKSIMDENEEISVKVEWKCMDIVKFNIRRYQKLFEIFDYFSKKENVDMDKLVFIYDDRILCVDDTPHSIDYNVARCVEGGVVSNSIGSLTLGSKLKPTSGIKIKFQCQKSKKPFETYIQKDEKLSIAMIKCAEHLELPLKSLKFEFDGDVIKGTETAETLEIEGEACVDVKIMNS